MTRMKRQRGAVMLIALIVIVMMLMMGGTIYLRVFAESRVADTQKVYLQALLVAEGGLERALNDLRIDFENSGLNASWRDGDINGMPIGPNDNAFYAIPYANTVLGSGSYAVSMKNVAGKADEVNVRSTGTVGSTQVNVEAYLAAEDHSAWANVIFGGGAAGQQMVNGNVNIYGPVHILGTGLNPTDYALDMGGGASIGNNYAGMPAGLAARVPPCPTVLYNGEAVQSLESTLRVKRGLVGLSGTSMVGFTDITGNGVKETMDATYVTDGYGGNQGDLSVHSDNGSACIYDLGDKMGFPSLSEPYQGYATYMDYLRANALVITDAGQLSELAAIKPTSVFDYSGPKGRIRMDGAGNLLIDGIVYVAGSLGFLKAGATKTITYTGKGSLVAEGPATFTVNLYTAGNNSFPANIMAIMTPSTITFNEASIDVMGLFYGETKISSQKQTNVAGTFVSNLCDMGTNVPSIYYVPSARKNLPPGLIGAVPVWFVHVKGWRKYHDPNAGLQFVQN